jgi:hypothetical protein
MMPVIKHAAVAPQSNPNINANYYDDDYELIYFENAYIISKKALSQAQLVLEQVILFMLFNFKPQFWIC